MKIQAPEQYKGKIIKVYFYDGQEPITGEYDGFTSEADDDDGANITVFPVGETEYCYGLYEDEIDHIEVVGNA